MKSLTTLFNAEKNKKTGLSPVWILKCPFPSTGTVYLSDVAFSMPSWNGGVSVKSLVFDWGQIDEAISDLLGMTMVSDFSLSLIIDPDEDPNIDEILWTGANNIETTDCELYLWFRDLDDSTDPPVKVWTGNIIDFDKVNEILYSVRMVDQSVRLDKYIGSRVTLAEYPNADPDDVGKVKNIVYGSVVEVPALLLESGAVTSLRSAITANQTAFYLSAGTGLANGNVIQIDDEKIQLTSFSDYYCYVYSCVRGYGGTTAVAHSKGATVFEVPSDPFVYLFADHPVKAISKVQVKVNDVLVDITSDCTTYTGQAGNNYTGYGGRYSGKAIGLISNYPAIQQRINLALYDPLTINNGQALNTTTVNDAITVGDNIAMTPAAVTRKVYPESLGNYTGIAYPERAMDGNDASAADIATTGYVEVYFPTTSYGTIVNEWVFLTHKTRDGNQQGVIVEIWKNANYTRYDFNCVGGAGAESKGTQRVVATHAVKSWDDRVRVTATELFIYEIWKEIEYIPTMTKSGQASRAGSATAVSGTVRRQSADAVIMSGNSTANSLVGEMVLIDGQGFQDDGSGTFTGVAGSLIERPDHVFKHLLYTFLSWPTASFYTNANIPFAAFGFAFAGVFNEYKKFKEWAGLLAWQCRSYFRFNNGQAQLLWRHDSIQ